MTELLTFGEVDLARNAAQRRILRGAISAAVVLHLILLAVLVWRPHTTPVRVTVAHPGAISAFVNVTPASTPTGTSGAPQPANTPRPVSLAPAAAAPAPEPASNESTGPAQTTGAADAGGPTRVTVGQIQLLKKVDPIYPRLMIAAHASGTAVLDATINPDGSIGDVKVLQSLGPLFDRAAIEAVKQWRYSPPGFEAILTVTVIFSLR